MVSIQRIIFNTRYFDRRVYVFIGAVGGIILFDVYAVAHSMYYLHWWLDLVVHFTGGLILGLALYYLLYANRYTARLIKLDLNRRQVFSSVVFWVLVVAITWEIIEFLYGRTFLSLNFPLDLFLDISTTSLGSLVAYWYICRHKKL